MIVIFTLGIGWTRSAIESSPSGRCTSTCWSELSISSSSGDYKGGWGDKRVLDYLDKSSEITWLALLIY